MPLTTKFWAFTDAGRFQPTKAHVNNLYNLAKLARLSAEEAAARAGELRDIREDQIEACLCEFDSDDFDELCEQEFGLFNLADDYYPNCMASEEEDAEEEADGGGGDSHGNEKRDVNEPPSKRTRSSLGATTGADKK